MDIKAAPEEDFVDHVRIFISSRLEIATNDQVRKFFNWSLNLYSLPYRLFSIYYIINIYIYIYINIFKLFLGIKGKIHHLPSTVAT